VLGFNMWRRYLGKVGKFCRTLWLIYPRHYISIFVIPLIEMCSCD